MDAGQAERGLGQPWQTLHYCLPERAKVHWAPPLLTSGCPAEPPAVSPLAALPPPAGTSGTLGAHHPGCCHLNCDPVEKNTNNEDTIRVTGQQKII